MVKGRALKAKQKPSDNTNADPKPNAVVKPLSAIEKNRKAVIAMRIGTFSRSFLGNNKLVPQVDETIMS